MGLFRDCHTRLYNKQTLLAPSLDKRYKSQHAVFYSRDQKAQILLFGWVSSSFMSISALWSQKDRGSSRLRCQIINVQLQALPRNRLWQSKRRPHHKRVSKDLLARRKASKGTWSARLQRRAKSRHSSLRTQLRAKQAHKEASGGGSILGFIEQRQWYPWLTHLISPHQPTTLAVTRMQYDAVCTYLTRKAISPILYPPVLRIKQEEKIWLIAQHKEMVMSLWLIE